MSAAVQEIVELEALLDDEAPKALHLVCGICWPHDEPAVAVCGYRTSGRVEDTWDGKPHCAKCLPWDHRSPLPCGHP